VNASTQKRMADTGLFLIRAMLAMVFSYHGSQKLFGWFGVHLALLGPGRFTLGYLFGKASLLKSAPDTQPENTPRQAGIAT